MFPPHNDDRGPGGDRLGCGLCIEPPRDGDGDAHLPGKAAEEIERRLPDHLLVDTYVGVDVIDAERLKFAGPGDGVLDVDEIAMIRTPYFRADLTASAMTVSSASPRIQTIPAPDFAAISTSTAPVSATFMSATISCPGNAFRSVRTACIPSLLTQGGPGLNPVRATTDRLFRDLYRTIDLEEIEGHLESCVAIQYSMAEILFIRCRAGETYMV